MRSLRIKKARAAGTLTYDLRFVTYTCSRVNPLRLAASERVSQRIPMPQSKHGLPTANASIAREISDACLRSSQRNCATHTHPFHTIYDAASRLKEVGTGGQNVYGYDGDGRRVRQVASGGSPLLYVWSTVLGEVAYEATSGDSAVRAYLYADHDRVALRASDRGFYWVHSDHLGSLKKLTRTNGTVSYRVEYDPHGQRVMEWSDGNLNLNSHKFTGHEYDGGTGLEYAKARMLNHNRGRFIQPDPARLEGSKGTAPGSLNLYSYVRNDGVNYRDESGMFANPPRKPLEPRFPPDPVQIWEPTNPDEDKVTREEDPGIPDEHTNDCQKFVDLIQGIADSAANADDFMDRLARTFTAADNSSILEMYDKANQALQDDRVRLTDSGFKQQFLDSNQARHFVAGMIAGFRLGWGPALLMMNAREGFDGSVDTRLNAVSTLIGSSRVYVHGMGVHLPDLYKSVSQRIKAEVCE